MIFHMRAHHTLLAVGFSYVKQEWGKPTVCRVCQSGIRCYRFYYKQIIVIWSMLMATGIRKCLHCLHTNKITNWLLLNYLIHQPTDVILSALIRFCVTLAGCYVGTGNLPLEERNMGTRIKDTLLGKSWDCHLSNGMLWNLRAKMFFSLADCGLMLTFR